ncbi:MULTISPECIES: ATP-binding protein [unclassified Saccharothrix]|uniref:ATP-binding protein n=1 Tax=unclassified Saccharothrix TaxID=2593673 RepID=UPI00307F69E7
MDDRPGVRNVADGGVVGPVVQAGSIGHVTMTPWQPERVPVPRQLPLAVRDFTGRAEHLSALDALLTGDEDRGAVVISALDGTAGVGKTALAVRWAHNVQHRFPGGTLYVNLRGYDAGAPADPLDVLAGFLGALGVPTDQVPPGLEARSGYYRSVLAGRRVLVVLDNAQTAAQVRPLLPGDPGCLVVVTSRASLTGLVIGEGATRVTLDLLTPEEALELVHAIMGRPRAQAEPDAVVELIGTCARLPLALRIAAGRVAAHPHLTLADLVAELRSDLGRWDALSIPADEGTAVWPVFGWSYHLLTDAQARMFRRLGLHPGPEIGLPAAAAVAGVEVAEARRLLDALAEAHMVEPVARDRYRLHDLLRAYAADRLAHDEPPRERDEARRMLIEWYAHHAVTAAVTIAPMLADWYGHTDDGTRVAPELTFADAGEAWAWAGAEEVNVPAFVRAAAQHGPDRATVALGRVAVALMALRARWAEGLEACHAALAAARRLGDRTSECRMVENLGLLHWKRRDWEAADDALRTALAPARELDDRELVGEVLHHLGWVCLDQQRFAEALDHLRAAHPLSVGAQDGRMEFLVVCHLGAAHGGLGDHVTARRHIEHSLALLRRAGHLDHEYYALTRLAEARQRAGDHAEAIVLCEQALDRETQPSSPVDHAVILAILGTSLRHRGDTARAVACWREALAVFTTFDDPRAADLRAGIDELEPR